MYNIPLLMSTRNSMFTVNSFNAMLPRELYSGNNGKYSFKQHTTIIVIVEKSHTLYVKHVKDTIKNVAIQLSILRRVYKY